MADILEVVSLKTDGVTECKLSSLQGETLHLKCLYNHGLLALFI